MHCQISHARETLGWPKHNFIVVVNLSYVVFYVDIMFKFPSDAKIKFWKCIFAKNCCLEGKACFVWHCFYEKVDIVLCQNSTNDYKAVY